MTIFSGHTAMVTGAGSGIGRAIARALAGDGATVCLVGRTSHKLEETAAAIPSPPPVIYPADLTVDAEVDHLCGEVQRQFGKLDILVLCAGSIAHGPVAQASPDDLDALYRANVRAPFRLIQSLLPLLRQRPGQIVVINSSVGLTAPANVGQFSATQHALKAVTDSLRGEVNGEGIRVLSVYPGRTATPRQEALYAKSGKEYRPELLLQPESIASMVVAALGLPRTAEVTDLSIRPMLKSY
jgi:NAD(P)-dependent dehydrogenase (short-subunit alcohol dehydrogenase family)